MFGRSCVLYFVDYDYDYEQEQEHEHERSSRGTDEHARTG
jgi:hypothetical protein